MCAKRSCGPYSGGEESLNQEVSVSPQWNGMWVFCERKELRKVERCSKGWGGWRFGCCFPVTPGARWRFVPSCDPFFQSPKTSCPLLHSRGNSKLHVWKYRRVLQSNIYTCDYRISCECNKLNVPITPQPIPTINDWSQEKDKRGRGDEIIIQQWGQCCQNRCFVIHKEEGLETL